MNRSHPGVLTLILFATAATSALAAGTPDQSCRAGKLGAAGKYAAALLTCESKAAKLGVAVEAECLSKASSKFTSSFDGAESKAGVSCNGLASTTDTIIGEMFDAARLAVPVPGGGGLCASLALKSTGKFAGALLGAWSKFVPAGDAATRDEALAKARATLEKAIVKAETKAGCSSSGQFEATRAAVEDNLTGVTACIGSAVACVEAEDDASAGGTVTTDPTSAGPTPEVPVTASLQTPNAGAVVLRVVDATNEPPSGFLVLGRAVDITAPPASAAAPLVLTFVIDASLLPADPNLVGITRNGVVIPDCTGAPGVADPDPCLQSRTILGNGNLELVALSSHASEWVPVTVDPVCPTTMVWTMRADTPGDDRESRWDIGWSGNGHHLDPVDGYSLAFNLDCGVATAPNCGTCTVTGIDPSPGNCRCQNNSRTICDEPGVADADDCGGATCQCFSSPPIPVSSAGTSTCWLLKGTADASGTWDPGLGSGEVTFNDRRLTFLSQEFLSPCPTCVGDATPNDGVRGGLCSSGDSAGQACDANGSDPTFPLGEGGYTSHDCQPPAGLNISGPGLDFTRTETTGNASMASTLDCGGSLDNCGGGACVIDPSGDGTCDTAYSEFCDGFVDEEGRGVFSCANDSHCDTTAVGDAGSCTLLEYRPCFPAALSVSGTPSPVNPTTVATRCVAASSSAAVNATYGFPGPARLRNEWETSYSH